MEELGKETDQYKKCFAKRANFDTKIAYLRERSKDDTKIHEETIKRLEKKSPQRKFDKVIRLAENQGEKSKDRDNKIESLYDEKEKISECNGVVADNTASLDNYTEEISKFLLGCEDDKVSNFIRTFYKAKNELDVSSQSPDLEIDQNKLKKLNEKERALKKINEEKSFLDILKSLEKDGNLILIFFSRFLAILFQF